MSSNQYLLNYRISKGMELLNGTALSCALRAADGNL